MLFGSRFLTIFPIFDAFLEETSSGGTGDRAVLEGMLGMLMGPELVETVDMRCELTLRGVTMAVQDGAKMGFQASSRLRFTRYNLVVLGAQILR